MRRGGEGSRNARLRLAAWAFLVLACLGLAVAPTVAAPDTGPPTWPGGGLSASNVTTSTMDLAWTEAIDDVGVTEYRVYRQGAGLIGVTNPPVRTWTVSNLTPDTSYTFWVEARDAAGNESSDGPGTTQSTADEITPGAGFIIVDVLQGLDRPVAIDFGSNGDVFVAEKDGILKVFDGLADPNGPDIVIDWRTIIHSLDGRGLLGLAVDPDYANGRDFVYVFYTYDELPFGTNPPLWNDTCPGPDGCTVTAKLSRLELDPTTNALIAPEHVLMENQWCMQYPSHSNGDLEFGPDGFLYLTAGDGASYTFADLGQSGGNPCNDPPQEGGALRSQDILTSVGGESADPVSFSGSVLRIDPDTGSAVPTNPLVGAGVAGDDRVIATGLRNPFRSAFRPGTDELWVGDVGWGLWEEINVISDVNDGIVENFGWPCWEGPDQHELYRSAPLCDELITGTLVPVVPTVLTPPYFNYNHGAPIAGCDATSNSVSALAFEQDAPYSPDYDGALFFADYSRACLWAMRTDGDGNPDPALIDLIATGIPVVDLATGPGGEVFVVDPVNFSDGAGKVRRIEYQGSNGIPGAAISVNTLTGEAGVTTFQFDGTSSSDPDGEPLTYAWDLDGNGSFDATTPTLSHVYPDPGSYSVGLRVTDPDGASDDATVFVNVSNLPPVATIVTPAEDPGPSWRVGDTISFSGTGFDPDDGVLAPDTPGQEWLWEVILHHCPIECHTHPELTLTGVSSGSFVSPDHEYPSYLEIRLTVYDSTLTAHSHSVDIYPHTSTVTLESSPSGLELMVQGLPGPQPTPFEVEAIENSVISVNAPSPQTVGATELTFVEWSDGGSQLHDIVTPVSDATLTATYGGPPALVSSGMVSGVTETWQTVDVGTAYADPVVVAGPASRAGADPGVVEIRNVTASSFEVRFREWDYLDEVHPAPEEIAYLVVERGISTLPSGAMLVAGTGTATGDWTAESFPMEFPASPIVLSTVVADTPPTSVATARLSAVTTAGFSTRLQHQESTTGPPGPSPVNWIAWTVGADSGAADGFGWEARTMTANHTFTVLDFAGSYGRACLLADMNTFNGPDTATVRFQDLTGTEATLQVDEETSLDPETTHTFETLGVLVVDCADSPLPPAAMVSGVAAGVTDVWQTVSLPAYFGDAVVVAGPASRNGGDPGVVEVRNIGVASFQIRFREWDYLDAIHPAPEDIPYLVVERGVSVLPSGAIYEAGTSSVSGANASVELAGGFGSAPVVISTVLADTEPSPVVVPRLDDIAPDEFWARLQAQEVHGQSPADQDVNWIAWSAGSDSGATDGFGWETGVVAVTNAFATMTFGGTYGQACVLADMNTFNGPDTASIRWRNGSAAGIDLQVDEEQSSDQETTHIAESLGMLVVDCS